MTTDNHAAPGDGAANGEALPEDVAFLAARGVPPDALREAARRAREAGTTASEALLAHGLCAQDVFYRALADEIGAPFLDVVTLSDAATPRAIEVGIAPLEPAPGLGLPRHVAAPRGGGVAALLTRPRDVCCGLALTTPEALRTAVLARCGARIAHEAANGLAERRPELSIRTGATRAQRRAGLAAALGLPALALLVDGGLAFVALAASVVFLGLSFLRLAACVNRTSVAPTRAAPRMPDADLPVYTILAPLKDEPVVAGQLCDALRRLDYPALCSKCTKTRIADRAVFPLESRA